MSTYLRLAEKIYNEVSKDTKFMHEPEDDFNTLMVAIRKNIKGTELRLQCQSLDFESLRMCSDRSKLHIDVTLIPQIAHKQEFILWLASFIEKISYGVKTAFPPIAHDFKLPSYATENEDNPCENPIDSRP